MPIPHCFHCSSFILNLKVVLCKSSNFVLIFEQSFGYPMHLNSQIYFRILIEIIDADSNVGKIKARLSPRERKIYMK